MNIGNSVESSSDAPARRTKRLWTIDEDAVLVEYVKKYGERNWSNVHKVTGLNRTGKSCRLRWRDQLHPRLNKLPFTSDEEALICDLQSQLGNKWSVIADYLPGRTDNGIKNFWYNRCKRYRLSIDGLSKEQGTSSSDTVESGFKAIGLDLSPEWIPDYVLPHPYLLPSTSMTNREGLELSSIQRLNMPQVFSHISDLPRFPLESYHAMCNFHSQPKNSLRFVEEMLRLDPVNTTVSSSNPINANKDLIVEKPDCNGELIDPLLTDGDIVDMWLNESHDQASGCQEDISAKSEANGDISATTTTDDNSLLPAWLNSPGLDEFLDQEPVPQNPPISEEPGSLSNSFAPYEFPGQEPLRQTTFVNQPLQWSNSTGTNGFPIQEPTFVDVVTSSDYGATGNFGASSASYMANYGWGETSETCDLWGGQIG